MSFFFNWFGSLQYRPCFSNSPHNLLLFPFCARKIIKHFNRKITYFYLMAPTKHFAFALMFNQEQDHWEVTRFLGIRQMQTHENGRQTRAVHVLLCDLKLVPQGPLTLAQLTQRFSPIPATNIVLRYGERAWKHISSNMGLCHQLEETVTSSEDSY